ncbi:SDR family NAD(P)-dependent oxidoreductase [Candidatus Entotheonella palauensis]|uniref:SDR family NAD(P)-dependent oxidoreductase n=1 Tax=Candidatus Entotheonella palauensis TaxID=93172 RepID=UPI0015C49B71|nr:SDR family NAD(P)-dependent oxidoreductase [Candidatus Entotheonella palauensis]
MNRLQNQVALVTGGNTGIGRAVCLAFAEEGADVVIAWYEREAEAQSLAEEIEAEGRRAARIEVDVTDETRVVAMMRQVEAAFGRLDILVNNAGIQKAQPITEMSVADWDRMQAVHLRGAFLCSREAAKLMIPQQRGRIINLCSQLGYIGRENYTAYSAAKGGMIAFTALWPKFGTALHLGQRRGAGISRHRL